MIKRVDCHELNNLLLGARQRRVVAVGRRRRRGPNLSGPRAGKPRPRGRTAGWPRASIHHGPRAGLAVRSWLALHGHHVLVCEDNPAVRELLSDLLRTDGAAVQRASTVSEATAAIASATFDLIILDRRLAGGDGPVHREPIQRQGWGATGQDSDRHRQRATGTHIDDAHIGSPACPTLIKPFRIDAFHKAVVDALNG